MSEQPRRRRRPVEIDNMPDFEKVETEMPSLMPSYPVDSTVEKKKFTDAVPEEMPHKKVKSQEKDKRSISCFIASAVCIITMVFFAALLIKTSSEPPNSWQIINYLVIPIILVLFVFATFQLVAKEKQILALIVGIIASSLCVYLFRKYIPLSLNTMLTDSWWRKHYLRRLLFLLSPYAILIIYAIPKKRRSVLWTLGGMIILLLQILPILLADVPGDWLNTSFADNSIGILALIFPMKNWKLRLTLIHIIDLSYALVFFFGMLNMPKRNRSRTYYSNDYPLLEQYKREHGM